LNDVEGTARFGGAQFGGVDSVVAELFLGELMLGVADQAVIADTFGVELELDLDVGGSDLEGTGKLIGETGDGLFGGVQKAVTAVAISRQGFEEFIMVTFPTDAETIEGDSLAALSHHEVAERLGFDVAEIGGA